MVREESPGHRVVRLKARSVMCQVGTCTNEAEFLVEQGADRIRAVCEKHLKALGIADAEVPPPDTV
jgi:hypothetical protein